MKNCPKPSRRKNPYSYGFFVASRSYLRASFSETPHSSSLPSVECRHGTHQATPPIDNDATVHPTMPYKLVQQMQSSGRRACLSWSRQPPPTREVAGRWFKACVSLPGSLLSCEAWMSGRGSSYSIQFMLGLIQFRYILGWIITRTLPL